MPEPPMYDCEDMENVMVMDHPIVKDLRRCVSELRAALTTIVDNGKNCIYSQDPTFREGSHAAFSECANIAKAAIDAAGEGL